jgi:hypothetical protein
LPISLPTCCASLRTDFNGAEPPTGMPATFRREVRDRSASPPARPAAAAVPIIAGTLAFCAAVPTEPPTFPTVDPTELPTPVSVPATPFCDRFDPELRGLELRDPAGEEARPFERAVRGEERDLLLEPALAGVRLRADEPWVLRLELREPEARRVVG